MSSESERILRLLREHADQIRRFGVRRLALFGSCARDAATAASDADFVVQFDRKTFDDYMGLKLYLEDLLDRRVDLVIEDAIKPRLRRQITEEMVHAPGL